MWDEAQIIPALLDRLCPMHCVLDGDGTILSAGPSLSKLRPDLHLPGLSIFQLAEVTQPPGIDSMAQLRAVSSVPMRLRLRFRDAPCTDLRGVLAPLQTGGAILNLGFGISILDAVRDYDLTSSDFAATDPTVEMLFLVEAKSAAMEASRKLTRQLQVAKISAEEQAFTDTLTGLKNRRALDHILSRMIATGQAFSLMHLDLDYFKQVNDTLGHAAGDHVLEEVARIMIEETREQDVIARVGGDEFVLVFHGLCKRRRIEDIATRLIARLERPIQWKGQSCRISGSLGTTISTDYANPDVTRMLSDADSALYAAKRAGRAQHRFFEVETSQPSQADPQP